MKIKQGIIILLITIIGVSLSSGQPVPTPTAVQVKPAAKAYATSTADEKARRLLAKMTLNEKIGQMVQYSRWGNKELTEAVQKELAGNGMAGSFLNVAGAAQTNDYQ